MKSPFKSRCHGWSPSSFRHRECIDDVYTVCVSVTRWFWLVQCLGVVFSVKEEGPVSLCFNRYEDVDPVTPRVRRENVFVRWFCDRRPVPVRRESRLHVDVNEQFVGEKSIKMIRTFAVCGAYFGICMKKKSQKRSFTIGVFKIQPWLGGGPNRWVMRIFATVPSENKVHRTNGGSGVFAKISWSVPPTMCSSDVTRFIWFREYFLSNATFAHFTHYTTRYVHSRRFVVSVCMCVNVYIHVALLYEPFAGLLIDSQMSRRTVCREHR